MSLRAEFYGITLRKYCIVVFFVMADFSNHRSRASEIGSRKLEIRNIERKLFLTVLPRDK